MKILIVENEIYLAQSINAKLTALGHHCEIASSVQSAMRNDFFDVVLLSTNISGQDFYPIIHAYKYAIIILMISYISNDTVTKPIEQGANDYILKPFMIEELVRKMNHYQEYGHLKNQNKAYETYFDNSFLNVHHDINGFSLDSLPIFINSSLQRNADSFAYQLGKSLKRPFTYVSLKETNAFNFIKQSNVNNIIYISDYELLKKHQKDEFFKLIEHRYAIVSATKLAENETDYPVVKLHNENSLFEDGQIMPIEEYVKYIITLNQNKLPDTELSKRLGISRKSLWEKRKKYGLIKQK